MLIIEPSLYHSECPSSASCRTDDPIELNDSTRSYSNKTKKTNVADAPSTTPNPLGVNMDTFNSFMLAQTQFAKEMSAKLGQLTNVGHARTKQISAGPGPHDNWHTLDTAEFFKIRDAAEVAEGCKLGSKGPWIKGADPECSKCKPSGLASEHHDSSCFRSYPWLRSEKSKQYPNNRGHNQNHGGYHGRGRNNGPYGRRGGRGK